MTKGTMIAAAAASLFLSGAVAAMADDKAGGSMVKCAGVNACKGHGGCAGASNSCKGKNGCKGQGFEEMSAADCTAKGGKVLPEK